MNKEEILLSEWFIAHEELVQYLMPIRLEANSDQFAKTKFKNKRDGVKNRTINKIAEFLLSLQKKKSKIIGRIVSFTANPIIQSAQCTYDKQKMNTTVNKLSFATNTLMDLNIQLNSKKLTVINKVIEEAATFLNFFSSNLVPQNVIFRFSDEFFSNRITDNTITKLKFQSKSLRNYISCLKGEINEYPNPLWMKSFPDFFSRLLSSALSQFDPQLSYVQPLEMEVTLSRYIFSSNHTMKDQIDKTAKLSACSDPLNFVLKAINTSLNLIPDLSKKTSHEQSIGLMFFFRIIFDRSYEVNSSSFFDFTSLTNQKKLVEMSKLPIKYFRVPIVFKPDESIVSVREFFACDHFFHAAALFLDETNYVTNPVDALYFFHRALLLIHKAALVRQVDGEATIDDINRLLCFDDLFSLLVGVLLASDIPDFFKFSDFVQKFTPEQCLSNSFEYAQSAIKALLMYTSSFNIENVIKETDAADTQSS